MYRYKHLLVVLNLDDQDRTTVNYAAMVSRMAQSEKVYFLYVADDLDIPEFLREEYPELLPPVDEFARAQVKKLVAKYFDGHPGSEKIYEIVEGLPLTEILRLTRRKQIDLVVIGGRGRSNDAAALLGSVTERVIRSARIPLLVVKKKGSGLRFLDALLEL